MTFLIQQTLIYAVPLMIVALAGVFAERSGIINLALEGIMVFGAFIGVWFVRILQTSDAILSLKQSGNWVALQGVELLTMLVAAAFGALFSLLLSFASINLRADQTIGGTALNLMAPALVLFFIRIIANQNTLQMLTGDAASWFMIKKSTLGIDKSTDLGFFGETFINKVYLATYDTIKKLADKGPCVLIGRCADYALKDRDDVINVFITAPLESRIKRVAARNNVSENEAKDRIKKTDKSRASYYNYYSAKEWGDAKSYNICIDSSLLGIEGTVELLKELIRIKGIS